MSASAATADIQNMDQGTPSTAPGATTVAPNDRIASLTDELFKKTSTYVRAELELTLDDYKLLEEMNKSTAAKYASMSGLSETLAASVADLQSSYEQLSPFLEKIDSLDEKVAKLEELAYAVDGYSKRLENRFKALEKPKN